MVNDRQLAPKSDKRVDKHGDMRLDKERRAALRPLLREIDRRLGTQTDIQTGVETGLTHYQVGRLRREAINSPTYWDVTVLAIYVGLSPNQTAALVGLYQLPDDGALASTLTPSERRMLLMARAIKPTVEEWRRLMWGWENGIAVILRERQAEEEMQRATQWYNPQKPFLSLPQEVREPLVTTPLPDEVHAALSSLYDEPDERNERTAAQEYTGDAPVEPSQQPPPQRRGRKRKARE